MEQEKLIHIAEIEKEARQFEENLQLIDNEIKELDEFLKNLEFFMNAKEKKMLSSLGKKVYVRTVLENKEKLFVDVGAGIVVKKTPDETADIIKQHIGKLREIRLQVSAQLEIYYRELEGFLSKIKNEK